jgi:hypothetical protein
MESGVAGTTERATGARVQDAVLADERAIEVARERRDLAREVGRKVYLAGSRNATRSASCFSLSFWP